MLPESGSVPVEVSVALCLLPDRGLRNRGEDPDGLFRTQVYVDMEIAADGNKTLDETHAVAERVHDAIEQEFPKVKHIMVHVNPAKK